jgi:hypothetical protein
MKKLFYFDWVITRSEISLKKISSVENLFYYWWLVIEGEPNENLSPILLQDCGPCCDTFFAF